MKFKEPHSIKYFLGVCTWTQMSSLYTATAPLKCSVCFHQWNMYLCLQQTQNLLFVLLLSPKRDFTTYCVLSTHLKITYPNRSKKTAQFIHFWSPRCFWVPHHQLERLLHILCQRSESVSWHYLYILPSFHIFPLEISNSFHKGFTLCAEAKKKSCFLPKLYCWHNAMSCWSFGVCFCWDDSDHTSGSVAQRTNPTAHCWHTGEDKAGPGNSGFREKLTSLLQGSACKKIFIFWVRKHQGAVGTLRTEP